MKSLIVTIDGPAGTGKSTVASLVAARLEIPFLDTGAMYRAVAWRCLKNNVLLEDVERTAAEANAVCFEFSSDNLLIDGKKPGEELRTSQVSEAASVIGTVKEVRDVLVAQQRILAGKYSLVSEGRDQGTIVFPHAQCKFFLTATPQVRAKRRWTDLKKLDPDASQEAILEEILHRDQRDSNREIAPLKPATDAIVIDNSEREIEEVIELLVNHVQEVRNKEKIG